MQDLYEVQHVEGGVPIKHWTRGVPVEPEAMQQVSRVARMPFVKAVALMPDVHVGLGATVGSVVATVGAVIPAAVGVDLGCGMMAVQTSLRADQLPDNLAPIRAQMERAVPHGRTHNGGRGDRGAWANPPAAQQQAWAQMLPKWEELVQKQPRLGQGSDVQQLGTLGTGNHFVELCLDEEQRVWVMLHSGSRGLGNRIGSHFIEKAKKDMRRWFINLPDEDLAYIPDGSELFGDYVRAVAFAQNYAAVNRELMMQQVLDALAQCGQLPAFETRVMAVNCHHNYLQKEHVGDGNAWVTRKGAVSAREGEMGIIPGSMGARSFIVRGRGNPHSLHSCSHGAGRKMSRHAARRTFTLEDHAQDTAGVECRRDADVLDETPRAYKSIEDVMAAQADLVEVVHTLKQVVCVKG